MLLSINLYTNNLKNRLLTVSAEPQIFRSRSRLASRQWSLAPNEKSEVPPCQIPDSSGCLCIGARSSKLSQAQVWEVHRELTLFHPDVEFIPHWVVTTGDQDLKTSLRSLDKTDFFTKEVDTLQLEGKIRISIHSAKDLPEPMKEGLTIVALTRGVDPSDSLVYNTDPLPHGAIIGTSSVRRQQNLLEWRSDLKCVDIRGNIEQRLALLDEGKVDGVVIAEAALIRLNLTHRKRMSLKSEVALLQGQLAVIARSDDEEMRELFGCIDVSNKFLCV